MQLTHQIMWGSLYLGVCFLVEVILLVWCTKMVQSLSVRLASWHEGRLSAAIITTALAFIVLAHTVQVWIWAGAWVFGNVLPDWNTALYFSLVTYTTLGYGDIVLGPDLRIFGAFASVAGLLAFGLSTAYLVALMTQIFEGKLTGSQDR